MRKLDKEEQACYNIYIYMNKDITMKTVKMTVMHCACYDGRMKNPHSAMISCNDGFRPVSFYPEALTDE